MYKNCFNLLRMKGIEFEKGLTLDELKQIELIYQIEFPDSLRKFLMMALPVSKGFYNWRNIQDDNVQFIKKVMNRPISDVCNMAGEINWCDTWGEEPKDEKNILKEVIVQLKEAPKLVPIYAHRYIPMGLDGNPPVISIHGVDIIYYGKNLEDYFYIEFSNKTQDAIQFQNITPIPFWSDIM